MSTPYEITIKVNGRELPPGSSITFVEVTHAVNRIPRASISLMEGETNKNDFHFVSKAMYAPGNEVSIMAKKGDKAQKVVFQGLIVRSKFRHSAFGPAFDLDLYDAAYRLTRQRNFRVFKQDSTDEQAFRNSLKLLKHNSSPAVKYGKVEMPAIKHKNLVQHDLTDWDFLCMRANACGRVVLVKNGEINVVVPKLQRAAGTITYGLDPLLEVELEADAQDLIGGFEAWNKELQKVKPVPQKTTLSSSPLAPKHYKATTAAKALGGFQLKEFLPTPMPKPELQAYTEGRIMRGKGSGTKGHLRMQERAEFEIGKCIQLKGFGSINNEKVYISGVKHQIDVSSWTVDVQLGLSGQSYLEDREWNAPEAQGLLGPAQGLHYAEVTKLKKDKEKKLLVQVSVPGEDKKTNLLWATMATPYAGKDHSVWFHPEVGDLVVLGYMNNDPRYPVILGGIHRTVTENPVKWDAQNKEKGIMLRQGIGILFNDKDGTVKITTAAKPAEGQTITLDKKKGEISLNHKTKSKVIINDKGLTIDTQGDLKINAKKIDINGKAITIKGSSIDLK